MYMNTTGYSLHKHIPFSVYGENLIILLQNFVIVLLYWAFNKTIGSLEKLFLAFAFAAYAFLLFQDKHISEDQWSIISSSNIALSNLINLTNIYL